MNLPPQIESVDRRPEAMAQYLSSTDGVEPSMRAEDCYKLTGLARQMCLAFLRMR